VRIIREPRGPPRELPYSLDHYDAAGNHVAELGRYPDLASGREAFAAAVRHRPQRHLFLRRGAQVIARNEPGG